MNNNGTRFITEMGIFIALGLVFDFVGGIYSGFIWPNGGSLSIAMLPIFIMGFRYGLKGGLLSGFAIGSIQMLWAGNAIIHWAQAILDYSIAYAVVGLAGMVSGKIHTSYRKGKLIYGNISILIAGLLRAGVHTIVGFIFFKEYLVENVEGISDLTFWILSASYNLGYMIPSIILCMILMTVILYKYSHLIILED